MSIFVCFCAVGLYFIELGMCVRDCVCQNGCGGIDVRLIRKPVHVCSVGWRERRREGWGVGEGVKSVWRVGGGESVLKMARTIRRLFQADLLA